MRGRPLKTSTVWKLVRERIASEECVFICHGLDRLLLEGRITVDRHRGLEDEIERLLEGAHTYVGWVHKHHRKIWEETSGNRDEFARQGRLAWLDHLIAEAKSKGD